MRTQKPRCAATAAQHDQISRVFCDIRRPGSLGDRLTGIRAKWEPVKPLRWHGRMVSAKQDFRNDVPSPAVRLWAIPVSPHWGAGVAFT
jgi:hypothetical protein